MRRLLLVTVVLLTAGCADAAGQPVTHPAASDPAGAPSSRLIVTTHQQAGPGGEVLKEGAVPEVRLVDAAGHRIETEAHRHGTFRFDGLTPGTYRLEADVRPCDGNCAYLDPPTDGCHWIFDMAQDLDAHVAFTVGRHCRVEVG